jgi:hypothetical protein
LPSTRADKTTNFFSGFKVFIGLAFLWRRPYIENGWSSISMAFAGCWGVSPPESLGTARGFSLPINIRERSRIVNTKILTIHERSRILISMRKNPHAVALGRKGGLKGGPARAKALTPERLSAIGKKAIQARWAKVRAAREKNGT